MLLFVQHNVAKLAFLPKTDFCSPPHDFTKYFIKKGSKDWAAKKVTNFNSIICLVKISENEIFFYLHFTSLYGG